MSRRKPKWVPHIVSEGARFHVLWWDTHGVHCKEPNCEINRRHLGSNASKKTVKCREGLPTCQNDATRVRIWWGGATSTCERHYRRREREAMKLGFPPGVYIPFLEPGAISMPSIDAMRKALLEIAEWPPGANEVWAKHLASSALGTL